MTTIEISTDIHNVLNFPCNIEIIIVKCIYWKAIKNKRLPKGANMIKKLESLKNEFINKGGILKTVELNELGFSSRQINYLIDNKIVSKIKHGFYEYIEYHPKEEVIIARLFFEAVIFLESAAIYYGYTDRIPAAWQISVHRKSKPSQYDISYPSIEPFYQDPKFINIGVDVIKVDGVDVRVYDRNRTICDILRYEKKLGDETFKSAIKRYVDDPKKNVRKLFEYAEKLNIVNKVQTYIGVRL